MNGLRTLLLLPLGLFVLFWGTYTIAFGEIGQLAPAVLLGVLALLLGVTVTNIEVFVLRPLRALLHSRQHRT